MDIEVINREEVKKSLEQAPFIYLEAAMITNSFGLIKDVAEQCHNAGKVGDGIENELIQFKTMILNLSSHSIVTKYSKEVRQLIEYSGVVFGKQKEFFALTGVNVI